MSDFLDKVITRRTATTIIYLIGLILIWHYAGIGAAIGVYFFGWGLMRQTADNLRERI